MSMNSDASGVRTWESLLSPGSPTSLRDDSPRRVAGSMSPPRKSIQGHTRSMTFSARNAHRLSLSFPVQPTESNSSSRATSVVSEPVTASLLPAANISNGAHSPGDNFDFMVVLAAQERRVLELKEELDRAEVELTRLKRQWAVHEANRKRGETRNTEQLRPVQNKPEFEVKLDEDPEDSIVRRSVELDRRKAMLIGLAKDSRRKVITGGHTRALSLLSPERSNGFHTPPFPAVDEGQPLEATSRISRSTNVAGTTPSTPSSAAINPHSRTRHSYQDTAVTASVGVKQIVEDLRAGLWTFAEDLRQATIGTEALQSPPPRLSVDNGRTVSRKPSKGSITGPSKHQATVRGNSKSRTRQISSQQKTTPIDVSNRVDTTDLVDVSTPRSSKKTDSGVSGLDDDWANWDSPTSLKSPGWVDGFPSAQGTGDTFESASEHKQTTAAGTSKDGIPWPALDTLSPGNLKRTASAIMKEWERSLTSTPSERTDPHDKCNAERASSREQEARLSLSNLP